MGASLNRHRSKQDYETPPELVEAIEQHVIADAFMWDLASDGINNKAPHYLTEREDALAQPWQLLNAGPGTETTCGAWCWLNPPYSNIAAWTAKCAEEGAKGVRTVMLVPASVGSNWYAERVYPHAYTLAIRPRVTFVGAKDPYPKDVMLCLFGTPMRGFGLWDWRSK